MSSNAHLGNQRGTNAQNSWIPQQFEVKKNCRRVTTKHSKAGSPLANEETYTIVQSPQNNAYTQANSSVRLGNVITSFFMHSLARSNRRKLRRTESSSSRRRGGHMFECWNRLRWTRIPRQTATHDNNDEMMDVGPIEGTGTDSLTAYVSTYNWRRAPLLRGCSV